MRDYGYDVANFTNIDPMFGTLEDFDNLVKEMHELGKNKLNNDKVVRILS